MGLIIAQLPSPKLVFLLENVRIFHGMRSSKTQMERNWNTHGAQMEPKGNVNGTQMTRQENANGTHMERKWNIDGTARWRGLPAGQLDIYIYIYIYIYNIYYYTDKAS